MRNDFFLQSSKFWRKSITNIFCKSMFRWYPFGLERFDSWSNAKKAFKRQTAPTGPSESVRVDWELFLTLLCLPTCQSDSVWVNHGLLSEFEFWTADGNFFLAKTENSYLKNNGKLVTLYSKDSPLARPMKCSFKKDTDPFFGEKL